MQTRLQALILEDSQSDALLLVRELRKAGYDVEYTRVETAEGMTQALESNRWDIILSDYSMPQFSATAGLKLVQDLNIDIPFIIVSGTMGEETAVAAMKAGAHDYFPKGRITRLASAINRELRERQDREQRRLAEQELRQAEERFSKAFQVSPIGITLSNSEGYFLSVNDAFRHMLGLYSGEIVGQAASEIGIWTNPADQSFMEVSPGKYEAVRDAEVVLQTLSSDARFVSISTERIEVSGEACVLAMWQDITDRKQAEQALKKNTELIQLLQDVTVAANAATEVNAALKFAVERICGFTGWPIGQIYTRSRGARLHLLSSALWYTDAPEKYTGLRQASEQLHSSEGLINKVFASGESEFIFDIDTMPPSGRGDEAQKVGIRSVYAFPILSQNDVLAVMEFFSSTIGPPDQALLETIPHIMTQVGHVIERTRANEEIMALYNATAYLFNADTVQDLADQIVLGVVQEFEKVDCGLLLLHPQTGQLSRLARAGHYDVDTETQLDTNGPGLIPKAIRENRIVYSPDVQQDVDYIANEPRTRSEMVVPLRTRDGIIGVLDLQSSQQDYFNQNDQRVLGAFAERAAAALEIIRYATELEQRVEERTQELQAAKERAEAILNNSSDAIILINIDGAIQQTNPRFVESFGYDNSELFGQNLSRVVSLEADEDLAQLLDTVAANREYRRLELLVQRKDGSTFPADAAFSAVISNQEIEIVCSLRDISAQKQLEQELRSVIEQQKELAELKVRFISMVSHEYRTPLSIIQTSSSMLMKYNDRLTEDKRQSQLGYIQEQVQRLTALLNDVLEISRAETVGVEFHPETLDLAELCQKLVEDTRQINPQHQIEFHVAEGISPITADPKLAGQIVSNLLSNAVKYSPDLGTVRVALERTDKALNLSVSDEGMGIPPEDLDNLFTHFHRARNVGQIHGSGLGLAIVKQAVDAHGGTISVESQVNQGTTFTVTFPT